MLIKALFIQYLIKSIENSYGMDFSHGGGTGLVKIFIGTYPVLKFFPSKEMARQKNRGASIEV